jgi:hypothetical protein
VSNDESEQAIQAKNALRIMRVREYLIKLQADIIKLKDELIKLNDEIITRQNELIRRQGELKIGSDHFITASLMMRTQQHDHH